MTGFADRFGALGSRQNQARQRTGKVLQTGTGAADALLILDLPDPRRRAFAQGGGKAPTQFPATGATVRQQPVSWVELVIHSPQALDPLFRCITAECFAFQHQQAVDARRGKSAFLMLTEDHGQHRAVLAGQLMGQAQQVAVVTA
ncbi:hypothetical protein D9M71_483740 [compost metagenome]